MISNLMLLGLGMLLGVRHALDPDHVIAVSTIVSSEKSAWRAARIGALWGVGHSVTVLTIGGAIIVSGIAIPPALGLSMEFAVAVMLVVLGAMTLLRKRTSGQDVKLSAAKPVLIGSVHGLAGSAGAALLVLAVIDTPTLALLYLMVFGIGTLVGMMLVTAAIALPLQAGALRFHHAGRVLVLASGAISIAFGFLMMHQIGIVDGLFTGDASWVAR